MVSQPSERITQVYRIEVWGRSPHSAFYDGVNVVTHRLYFLQGDITPGQVERICTQLLADPVAEQYIAHPADEAQAAGSAHFVDVTLLPGVTDPAADNLVRAAHLLGIDGLVRAATGQRYLIDTPQDESKLEALATRRFANPVIQRVSIDEPIAPPFVPVQTENDLVELVPLKDADDDGLMQISKERRLSLDLNEMRAIRDYYQEIDREPTDAELEMLAQTWSEHCVHKTFKAKVTYTGPAHGTPADSEPVTVEIDGILNTYIRAATEKVNKDWVVSAFVDNAGIIRFDDEYDLAFKVETHNRPSAIEPFGGANTGSGGVIRDVLGVSARPIANTDILCFGPPDLPDADLPEGVLHPRRVAEGVVTGIEDYGNKMGIPTVSGALYYHRGYTSNPLVFAGCLGILPRGSHPTAAQPDDLIVVIGGRTGRDGLRGATFSSMEMDITTSTVSGGAVQIGNPIQEKQVQEVVLRARDEKLYTAITDCGAGGLSSAVGEMGEKIGATVKLETVPLKYPGLQPWEIWLSEAQERMVMAVPPENWERLQEISAGQDVEATAIGVYEPTGRLTLTYNDKVVGDLAMAFLHDGIPQRHLEAVWSPPVTPSPPDPLSHQGRGGEAPEDYGETLLKLLAMPTIRSKEDVIRRYDHEVQTGTAVKPLVGVHDTGPSDAVVIVPLDTLKVGEGVRGVALSVGMCPQYTELDPYAMAWAAIDEAIRNLVAVGADPDQIAILDNFSWGNTNLPDRMGELVRCAQGCYDAAVHYGVPFISGKDSLNNEYLGADGERHAIPGTLVISAVGIVPDVSKTVTMDLKEPGNRLYVVGGPQQVQMGGTHYNELNGVDGGVVPQPPVDAMALYRLLYQAIQQGIVVSCHDVSEGGLVVALAEMGIASGYGIEMIGGDFSHVSDESDMERQRRILFSESNKQFIVEVHPDNDFTFQELLGTVPGLAYDPIGDVIDQSEMTLATFGKTDSAYRLFLSELENAWRGHVDGDANQAQKIAPLPTTKLPVSRTLSTRTAPPKVLILHANGTNRDRDAVLACELAGGDPEIVHVNQLISGERDLLNYHMLVVPGGFSYGDDLGAGVLWSVDLRERLTHIDKFVADGRPVLGICNGFQALVKAGLIPGSEWDNQPGRPVTLTYNERGHFECRWVYLQANTASPSLFTDGLIEPIHCPVAHGEGRIAVRDEATLGRLWDENLAALIYVDAAGNPAGYPVNPNGSAYNIAGLTNPAGNVFGLMPHPENHIFPWQHPRHRRGESGMDGLRLFQNGIKFA